VATRSDIIKTRNTKNKDRRKFHFYELKTNLDVEPGHVHKKGPKQIMASTNLELIINAGGPAKSGTLRSSFKFSDFSV